MENFYFLDNASTTKPFEETFDIMKKAGSELFFNPSASYKPARNVRKEYELARESIKNLLCGSEGSLIFTSSASESNNTALCGVHLRAGQVVLISAGEHPSVYNTALNLEKKGVIVKVIPLTVDGKVDENAYAEMLKGGAVALVSIIHCSNETGSINDIKKLCQMAKNANKNIIFHSDGVQAFGKIKVNLRELGIDMYTVSSHKVYSPRGVGGLWIKKGVTVDPLILGGGQEMGYRSSTENVLAALAFNYSAKRAIGELRENYDKVKSVRDELLSKLRLSEIGDKFKVNSTEDGSPYILSLSFDGLKGEVLMNSLEADNIFISTGSACSAKKAGNRILENMKLKPSEVIGSVRISFSPYITYDTDYIVGCIEKNVLHLLKNQK